MAAADPGIALLVPDLPGADALLPFLRRMDAARWYTNGGPLLREFEALMQAHWPGDETGQHEAPLHAVALNSGTSALELALLALSLPKGASVLLPSFTFPATASAVLRAGLQPLFADVSTDRWQLEPDAARALAGQHPVALVMPVATFGLPVDTPAWDAFVVDTGIPVLVDAAGAFGQQAVGASAHYAFSLHATKPFGIGEGGVFATRDGELAERVRRLANFGYEQGRVTAIGSNGKLSEYGAAVALAQWQRWPQVQARRRQQWRDYPRLLATLLGVRVQAGFATEGRSSEDPHHQPLLPANVVLQLPQAAAPLRERLAEHGIETRAWYCPPLHRQPAFAHCPRASARLPQSDALAEHALGLPWHTRLSLDEMLRIRDVMAAPP